jgi:hypothetical protein
MAVSVVGTVAAAAGIADQIVRQLQDDGYTDIVLERTWLGRIRITAVSSEGTREIILNPSTGEILRDLWIARAGGSKTATLIKDPAVTPPKKDDGKDDGGKDDDGGDDKDDDGGKDDGGGDDNSDDKDDHSGEGSDGGGGGDDGGSDDDSDDGDDD